MFKKKINYKLLIVYILGVIVSIGFTYGATNYLGDGIDVTYDNTNSGLSSSNAQDALDELYNKKTCPDGHYCKKLKTTLELGDYISYTPSGDPFTPETEKTGSKNNKEMNPSELNLWRVLNINDDGTVDIISDYVTSNNVYFVGKIGYKNFVGYLNELAKQYETPGITVGSRHFGYDGQTEYITKEDYFVNPAPWTCSTGETCIADWSQYEEYGGGDMGYLTDYNQLQIVLGTGTAYKPGTASSPDYWIASRSYDYTSAGYYDWECRRISSGSYNGVKDVSLYHGDGSSFKERSYQNYALRPIVTLSSELSYEGFGTYDYPMNIKGL